LYLFVDRNLNEERVIHIYNDTPCSNYSNVWTIELNERLPINWRQDDGSDDPKAAPGDGKWAELGPAKDMDIAKETLQWSASLGRLLDGTAAGRLSIAEIGLSPEIYTPTNIYFTAGSTVVRDQVQFVTLPTNSVVLRQVKAYQTFVDVVLLSASCTE